MSALVRSTRVLLVLGLLLVPVAGRGQASEDCPAGKIGVTIEGSQGPESICLSPRALAGLVSAVDRAPDSSIETTACPCWDHQDFITDVEECKDGLRAGGGIVDGRLKIYRLECVENGDILWTRSALTAAYFGDPDEFWQCSQYGSEIPSVRFVWNESFGVFDPITEDEAGTCIADLIWGFCNSSSFYYRTLCAGPS